MTKPIQEVLDAFEPALAAPVPDYDTLIGLFRALVVPADVTADDLTRLYTVCYRLLGIATAGPPVPLEPHLSDWRAGHLVAVAADVVERTMVDRNATTRAWIAMMCPTEIDDPVEGMGPVLERLAADPDPDVAGTARRHLARHY